MKKYLVLPGVVTSRTDGDCHLVTDRQLIDLYGVHKDECEIYSPSKRGDRPDHVRYAGLIVLHPRYDGVYLVENQKPFDPPDKIDR